MLISCLEPTPDLDTTPSFESHAAPLFAKLHQSLKSLCPQPVHLNAKMTHSTTLAHGSDTSEQHILAAFRYAFKTTFSKKASHRLPQRQPWDYAIDLKPDTTMKSCGIYHLIRRNTLP